jgi:hypothetical protein
MLRNNPSKSSLSPGYSFANVCMHFLNSSMRAVCTPLPPGVPTCRPPPQPKGNTNLRFPLASITTSASRGRSPPRGCESPRWTKWLYPLPTPCTNGKAWGAADEKIREDGSRQIARACNVGESAYKSGSIALSQ